MDICSLPHIDYGARRRLSKASAYIITAVMASGGMPILTQLGWVVGAAVTLFFSLVTGYASTLLASMRGCTYMDAIRRCDHLTGKTTKARICGILQILSMVALAICYTTTASMAMIAVIGRSAPKECPSYGDPCKDNITQKRHSMIIFGGAQVLLSLIPSFEKMSWPSVLAAVMSITSATIGIGLGIVQVVASDGRFKDRLLAAMIYPGGGGTPADKAWPIFLQELGTIAFPYTYSHILLDIRDTLHASEFEAQVGTMRRAIKLSVAVTAPLYILRGVIGYAAFGAGAGAPRNLVDGFHESVWLRVAQAAHVIHLAGAYQVCYQPLFAFVEMWDRHVWPQSPCEEDLSSSASRRYCNKMNYWFRRLVWRVLFVILTTVLSTWLPSPLANDVLGFVSALTFWPLTIYFPVHNNDPKWSLRWVALMLLSFACFIIAGAVAIGCIAGIVSGVKAIKSYL